MSPESAAVSSAAWPVLSAHERRILGVLVEKAQTTSGGSPLSLNALVTGSNQKSNRDPILNLSDAQVEEAVLSSQKRGLVTKIIGGRVEHFKHALYDAWKVSKVELAVLGELLLRGPQTEGELRARASRMEPIEDLESLRGLLRQLKERGLIVYLSPEGRRGTMLTHGFQAPEELDRLRTRHSAEAASEPVEERPASHTPSGGPAADPSVDSAHTEIAALKVTVAEIQSTLAVLRDEIRKIKEGLGLS